ncbi:hypothetical protein MBLNU457_4323t2 [Dothideomycetes sp. NU457]
MADKYILKITAGPDYDAASQKEVQVNTEKPTSISSSQIDASCTIRVQNYRGLPEHSPNTSPYFADSHKSDLYSLEFNFTPKSDINGHDLVFGNDFDHPIRDKLPPGFDQAFKIVKWFIDPGLYGDVYADEPHLYGPALSSINTFRVCGKDGGEGRKKEDQELDGKVAVITEGGEGDGEEVRKKHGVPDTAAARKKHFLTEANLSKFTFEEGRSYKCDFFNPYLDFNEFSLKLPGFGFLPGMTLPVITYWDGQPLRYVLKNRKTDQVLFVVIFTLIPKDQLENADSQAAAQKDEKNASAAGKVEAQSDDLD